MSIDVWKRNNFLETHPHLTTLFIDIPFISRAPQPVHYFFVISTKQITFFASTNNYFALKIQLRFIFLIPEQLFMLRHAGIAIYGEATNFVALMKCITVLWIRKAGRYGQMADFTV